MTIFNGSFPGASRDIEHGTLQRSSAGEVVRGTWHRSGAPGGGSRRPSAGRLAPDDVAFVGENDLPAALGYSGGGEHPAVVDAVRRVREVATEKDVTPGIAARSAASRLERSPDRVRFFLLGADLTFLKTGVTTALEE